MGFLKCTITFFFRALFLTALVGLSVKNFLEINKNLPSVQKSLKLAESKLPKHPIITQVFEKADLFIFEVLNIHCGLLLLTSLLALFKFRHAKLTMFLYVLLELALHNNYLLFKDDKNIHNTLKWVSLFGSILYI